jgi:two-component system CitB family sensor kinase
MGIDRGTLGPSARAKVPLLDSSRKIVGAVSVGIRYSSVRAQLLSTVPSLLLYAGAALAVGVLAAFGVSRRLQRRTHGLAFADISALLDEREAMLHGIREGVVALDARGRIRLVNDEAQRLLGLGPDAAGRALDEVLPPGRTTDVLAGRVDGADLLTVSGGRVLVANRMPTADGGAVATLRDRTELERLGRELDSTHGLLDALRAQDHEHANRLHTLLGLLELGLHDEAVDFVAEVADGHRASAEQIAERVHDPLLSALLVGKSAIAAERGVSLRISPDTLLPDHVVDPRDLVTVLGNLIDNALDVATFVEVELLAEGTTAVLRVSDNGPGVPPGMRELVFTEGWSTKAPPAHRGRGLGLALVRRLAERYGGMARVTARAGGGAVFTVVLPEALGVQELTSTGSAGPMGSMGSMGESR